MKLEDFVPAFEAAGFTRPFDVLKCNNGEEEYLMQDRRGVYTFLFSAFSDDDDMGVNVFIDRKAETPSAPNRGIVFNGWGPPDWILERCKKYM
jgi:hypothetical protein